MSGEHSVLMDAFFQLFICVSKTFFGFSMDNKINAIRIPRYPYLMLLFYSFLLQVSSGDSPGQEEGDGIFGKQFVSNARVVFCSLRPSFINHH